MNLNEKLETYFEQREINRLPWKMIPFPPPVALKWELDAFPEEHLIEFLIFKKCYWNEVGWKRWSLDNGKMKVCLALTSVNQWAGWTTSLISTQLNLDAKHGLHGDTVRHRLHHRAFNRDRKTISLMCTDAIPRTRAGCNPAAADGFSCSGELTPMPSHLPKATTVFCPDTKGYGFTFDSFYPALIIRSSKNVLHMEGLGQQKTNRMQYKSK